MNLARRILMARRMGTPDCDMPDFDPYWDDVVLLLKGDGPDGSTNIIDSSINNYPVTVEGNARISTDRRVYPGESSVYFDGASHCFLSNYEAFTFGINPFTVEAWVYPLAFNTADYPTIFSCHNGSNRESWIFSLTSSSSIMFYGADNYLDVSTLTINLNEWSHVSVSRESNNVRIFVNGILSDTFIRTGEYNCPTTGAAIGKQATGNSRRLFGYIQDLRITKNRARYTDDFALPCAPFPTTGL